VTTARRYSGLIPTVGPPGRPGRVDFELVHWAGTETATTSHGAIDGAVRSGQRAAAEILGGPPAQTGAGTPMGFG
jgi:monoamine oxidase